MKTTVMFALLLTISLGWGLDASAAGRCNGVWADRPAPGGGTRKVCLDGKYSTCMRDSWSAAAKARCAEKKAAGVLR
jgi:hypothetical protein